MFEVVNAAFLLAEKFLFSTLHPLIADAAFFKLAQGGLEIGKVGLDPTEDAEQGEEGLIKIRRELKEPGPERLFQVAEAFRAGMTVEDVFNLSFIDPWFLDQIEELVAMEEVTAKAGLPSLDKARMRQLKRAGFSDARIAKNEKHTTFSLLKLLANKPLGLC